MKRSSLILLAAAALLAGACGRTPVKTAGITYENMDTTARPGDDFARYATGRWAALNPQPPEYPMWGVTTKVYDDNVKALAEMIKEIAAAPHRKGSIEQKIGDLFNQAMDSVRRNEEGAAPLKAHIAEMAALSTREELLHYAAVEHDSPLFGVFIAADEKDAVNNILCICQGGLTLGNRDYYLSDDPQNVRVRELMLDHMRKLFVLAGNSEEEAADKVARIWAIENEIAVPYYSQEKQRIPEENYHKISVDSLQALCGSFPWKTWLADAGYGRTQVVDLGQPEPVAKICDILMTAPLEDLKAVYEWNIISGASALLSDDFIDENFDYASKRFGTKEKTPRWKQAENLVDGLMSDAIGQMYVKKYFPKAAKKEMLELVGNLQKSLAERIKAQEWMCDSTKAVALEKLAAYTVKVGYPDKWDDISGLVIDPAKSLYENVRAASNFYWQLNYDKKYEKPVDKSEWHMPAQMVNAYYNPTTNEICFPAGFLQPPLFDLNADAAANYGSIGVVIGHEMTHGFDDQGRLYDKNGNLCDWWTPADGENFQKPCDAMADYFSTLWVIPGELKANGRLCLGENIADHGGLNVAFDALKLWEAKHGRLPDDNGFTPEQRFFLSYATVWASVTTPDLLRYLVMMDVHSPARLRVNGALPQIDAWYEAFGISEGDSLYVAPENRVKVW
ncbi:MAG: M13 family metallopeptidase [Bacteroidales bacterium]|nr:M13 family metallopeptidase [Bacteroidales bacterium]